MKIKTLLLILLYFPLNLIFNCILSPGLLQGQRTGTMWLVARSGQNDEGRGNVTVALLNVSITVWEKNAQSYNTLCCHMQRNPSFNFVLKLHWMYYFNSMFPCQLHHVQRHFCVHLPKHKYKGNRLSDLQFVTLSSCTRRAFCVFQTQRTRYFLNYLPIWIWASLCVIGKVHSI